MFALASAAQAFSKPNLATWKQSISNAPTPSEGCFSASFPDTTWHRVACTVAPLRPYLPRSGRAGRSVGDGNDYAAVSTGATTKATGSFPAVSGVTKEKNNGHTSEYSLQLNSNFSPSSPACASAGSPSECQAWEQFVFAEDGGAGAGGFLFMQYWLINYNATCPAGWNSFTPDCYRNSDSGVSVPAQPIKQLANLQLSGQAKAKGNDTITLVTADKAYSVTGKDNVVGLAKFWRASEFNIIGNGNGSGAKFNKGSSVTVQIALKDGGKAAPTCLGPADGGTTAEFNNLNLVGGCTATKGATPSIKFTESN